MSHERYAVLGDPVEHSLSPVMQSAAFAAAGMSATYERVRVPASELAETVHRLRAGRYRGFNVTIPHKEAVLPLLDSLDEAARRVGAVNTVLVTPTGLAGYNTDVAGVVRTLEPWQGTFRGGEAVLLGAGGAARAAAVALTPLVSGLSVVNRTLSRAEAVAALHPGGKPLSSLDPEQVRHRVSGCRLIVNATPLGMQPGDERTPLPPDIEPPSGSIVFDMVYGRRTALLHAAQCAGCVAVDGLEMLVQQGAAAFRLWTGAEPDTGAMREACLRALAEAA